MVHSMQSYPVFRTLVEEVGVVASCRSSARLRKLQKGEYCTSLNSRIVRPELRYIAPDGAAGRFGSLARRIVTGR